MDKMSSAEEKFEAFVEFGMWRRAYEEAVKMRDPSKLQEVRRVISISSWYSM